MSWFFDSTEKVAELRERAAQWVGTPFFPNAMVRGTGVSCQKLAAGILQECGVFPEGYVIPSGPMTWGRHNSTSLIAAEMDSLPQFTKVFGSGVSVGGEESPSGQAEASEPFQLMPGDLIGYRVGACIQHVGLALGSQTGIHVMRHQTAEYYCTLDASFLSRMEAVWRPNAG